MFYQTPQFMADLLEKAQVLQLAVIRKNDGHSLHIDTNSHNDYFYGTGFHAGFDVTLFDGSNLVESWDFMSNHDADELNHILEDLTFKISRL